MMDYLQVSSTSCVIVLLILGSVQARPPEVSNLPLGLVTIEELTSDQLNETLFEFDVNYEASSGAVNVMPFNSVSTRLTDVRCTSTTSTSKHCVVYNINAIDGDKATGGNRNYELKYTVSDSVGNNIKIPVALYVEDQNDNSPVFEQEPYKWDILERPFTKKTFTISASDADSNANGRLTFSMKPVTQSSEAWNQYNATFSLTQSSTEQATITLQHELDYETNNYYQFNISAQDDGNPSRVTYTDLIIRVLDVQDEPPFFTGSSHRTNVNENTPIDYTVQLSVNARDGDTGVAHEITYSLHPYTDSDGADCKSLFNITDGGTIFTTAELDRDSGVLKNYTGLCKLNVTASETTTSPTEPQYNSTEAWVAVSITVDDADDNSPKFAMAHYIGKLPENSGPGSLVNLSTLITVQDIDQGDFARIKLKLNCLQPANCSGTFRPVPEMVQGSGDITLQVAVNDGSNVLDYEQTKTIELQILAVGDDINKNDTARINIQLEDRNDNDPKFDNTSYEFTIDENTANETYVGSVKANDLDLNSNLSYNLSGGSNKFRIDPHTGDIFTTCNSEDLNRESRDTYDMSVMVKDVGRRSDTVPLQIVLLDENDNAPEFTRSVYEVYLDENDDRFLTTPLVVVEANDIDEKGTVNSNFTFFLESTTEAGFFSNISIDDKGEVYLNFPIDYERLSDTGDGQQKIIKVTVESADQGTPIQNASAIVQIFVRDINDNAPVFEECVYSVTVSEAATSTVDNHTVIGGVNATDMDDTERNSHVNYFIVDGALDKFTINASSGGVMIQANAELDRETTPAYNITILAVDQGYPSLTGSTSMIVTIEDENDTPPRFTDFPDHKSILENMTIGSVVYESNATDMDLDHNLEYHIESVTAEDETGKQVNRSIVREWFNIRVTDGAITLNKGMDRELAQIVYINVIVIDIKGEYNTPQNDTAQLMITLEDVNDNVPVFEKMEYQVNVSENALNNQQLLTVKATDVDVDRDVTYKLDNGSSPINSFSIDPKTGVITKVGPIDREMNKTVVLTIAAFDDGNPIRSGKVNVVVDVVDFNDNAPFFAQLSIAKTLPEGCYDDEEIVTIIATDEDEGLNALIDYSIVPTNTNFSINSSLGIISVHGCIDREEQNLYELTIIAEDSPKETNLRKTSSMTLTVTVSDVNDNSPVFTKEIYYISIREDADIGSIVGVITAKDADEPGTCNSSVSYNLTDSMFIIDSNTGTITTTVSLIEKVGVVRVIVVASNCEEDPRQTEVNVTINISDVNLNSPVISNFSDILVYECVPPGSVIKEFTYTDNDFGINANAFFNISAFNNPLEDIINTFELKQNGTLILKTNLDVNTKEEYQFQIQATDHGVPPLSSEKQLVTVRVLDVNNHQPYFKTDKEFRFTVKENVDNSFVGETIAVDEDKNSITCYSLYASYSGYDGYFEIGNTTGKIELLKSIDREAIHAIDINVSVEDCTANEQFDKYCSNVSTPSLPEGTTQKIVIAIEVEDVDDNPPVFINSQIAAGMKRDVKPGTLLDLSLKNKEYVSDNDTDANGIASWRFENNGSIIKSDNLVDEIPPHSGLANCSDGFKHVFCISPNGTIMINRYISETLSGFFIIPVKVMDAAGESNANVTVYLISNAQMLSMTVRDTKENVALKKDEILSFYSNITGYRFVYDSIQNHKLPSGEVTSSSSDLFFHVVNPVTQEIIPDKQAIAMLDRLASSSEMIVAMNKYHITGVDKFVSEEPEEDDGMQMTFILIGVSAAEALLIAIIIYASVVTKNKYKMKLKAVSTRPELKEKMQDVGAVIPGSNQYSKTFNPLLNADIDLANGKGRFGDMQNGDGGDMDGQSVSSLGDISVGDDVMRDTYYDRIEEREVTLDMFGEDVRTADTSEDLLTATLQLHDLRKSTETLDMLDDSPVDTLDTPFNAGGYMNETFDDLESTEI